MIDALFLVAIAALVGVAAACGWYEITWTLDERKQAERRDRRRWS